MRARILLQADVNGPNWPDEKIAEADGCLVRTIFPGNEFKTAWSQCKGWLQVVLQQLEDNRNTLLQFIKIKKELKAKLPKSTYFVWVDCDPLKGQRDPFSLFTFFLKKNCILFW